MIVNIRYKRYDSQMYLLREEYIFEFIDYIYIY